MQKYAMPPRMPSFSKNMHKIRKNMQTWNLHAKYAAACTPPFADVGRPEGHAGLRPQWRLLKLLLVRSFQVNTHPKLEKNGIVPKSVLGEFEQLGVNSSPTARVRDSESPSPWRLLQPCSPGQARPPRSKASALVTASGILGNALD